MQHASQIAFGRPEICVAPAEVGVDKWDLLNALTEAAQDLSLTHRTLNVLKALLSFLPTRQIEPGSSAIVFPSNRKLSERLGGLPESTLRRHLGQLVKLGFVSRHDSPNGKRYARRVGSRIAVAFGFDLSPLAHHAAQIHQTAHAAQERSDRLRALKARIAAARQHLLNSDQEVVQHLLEHARLVLRRKATEAQLSTLCAELEGHLHPEAPTPITGLATTEMSASNSQNERHIQDSDKSISDSDSNTAENTPSPETADTLTGVLNTCKEIHAFFPGQVNTWQDLSNVAYRITPMLGIDTPVYHEACSVMGSRMAATLVACLLEKAHELRNPGAYLRRLSQKARMGQFGIEPMLQALENRHRREIVS